MSEHAIREYLKTIGNGGGGVSEETDPVFTASPAHGISAQDIADWNDKQDELVSGTNIKTINGQSLLGSGDLPVAPPVTSTDVPTADTISEFDSDAHMNSTDMTTQDVSDFVDGLNISGMALGDFVVEQGASGIWTCRRWNSGIAECWGTSTFTNVPLTTTWGNCYYSSSVGRSIGFPSSFFTSVTDISALVDSHGGLVGITGDGRSTSAFNFYLWSTKSETRSSLDVFVHAKGKWK